MDLNFLQELLDEPQVSEKSQPQVFVSKYPKVEQKGPLRHFDKEMRCMSTNCRSSTFFKLNNLPMCMAHCLHKMNEMLYDFELK